MTLSTAESQPSINLQLPQKLLLYQPLQQQLPLLLLRPPCRAAAHPSEHRKGPEASMTFPTSSSSALFVMSFCTRSNQQHLQQEDAMQDDQI